MVTSIPIQRSVQGVVKRLLNDNIQMFHGSGGPLSGIAPYGTGAGIVGYGAIYIDATNGNLYINRGSVTTPYWYPLNFTQAGLLGAFTNFMNGTSTAVTDTSTSLPIAPGVRIHGQGIAEADSGGTIAFGEDGAIASLLTTDEDAHTIALGAPGTTPIFQPNSHGPIVVEARCAQSSAITDRRLFIGFLGTVADALDPPVTGSGVTATLVQDDLAGFGFDSGFTDADRLYAFHNKSDEAANQDVTAGSRDLGVDQPAAGTYATYRVEISAAGVMTCFKDKVLLLRKESALDIDEEVGPALVLGAAAAAVKTMLVKHFGYWGTAN